ncbi:putative iron-regulated membrane protein [Caldalkalibacillus uzonensis]|uniref:Iron-regulated membrane protein n=1 Tax=Caldalkalibacillus uzonensis TaxID=353224 RepID=A0ABU0CVR1_9BACI|nr:putative iron-regulated membrane protein [Caldalkalibacillus uzonensis]
METSKQTHFDENTMKQTATTKTSLYQTVWRWHFYAGLIFAPFLVILAFSGAVYLFHPQVESYLYHDLYEVQEKGEAVLSPSVLVDSVTEAYPEAVTTSLKFYDDPNRTTEVGIVYQGERSTAYVNP